MTRELRLLHRCIEDGPTFFDGPSIVGGELEETVSCGRRPVTAARTDVAMLDERLRALCKGENYGVLTTLFPDGRPQSQVMWIDCDDDHVIVNTEVHRAKYRNLVADPRVAITIWMTGDPTSYFEVRGTVDGVVVGDEVKGHLDTLAQRYFKVDEYPYPIEPSGPSSASRPTESSRSRRSGVGAARRLLDHYDPFVMVEWSVRRAHRSQSFRAALGSAVSIWSAASETDESRSLRS